MRRKISRRCVTAEPLAVLPPVLSLRIFKRARISEKLRFNAKFYLLNRGLWWMKFCRSPRDARSICLPRMHVIAHILAASRRFTNVHRCGSRLLLRVYFLCLVSCASPHLRQDRAVPLKHANLSCIKFSLLRRARRLPHFVMLICCEPSSPYFATAPATYTYRARASFSGRALKFQSKILI